MKTPFLKGFWMASMAAALGFASRPAQAAERAFTVPFIAVRRPRFR